MAEYLIQDTTLDAIADAINAKTGGSSAMTPAEMVEAIGSIQTGGGGGTTVEHYQYTHTEDWLSDAVGNSSNFYQTYLSTLYSNKNSGAAICSITNNTASQYVAVLTARNFEVTNKTAWMRSNGPSNATLDTGSTSISFYISAGSQIDIYIVR